MVSRPLARRTRGTEAVFQHQHDFFTGHEIAERQWPGPIKERVPDFSVHEISPGPRYSGWTYATSGVWTATHDEHGHGLEFVMTSSERNDRAVELLSMTAFYHAGPLEQRLDVGHTTPIGEPWLPGSACDHLLVCLPYPYGPELEICEWKRGHARHLWLLPITRAERDHKMNAGLEALEQLLEAAVIDPTDPTRPSVV